MIEKHEFWPRRSLETFTDEELVTELARAIEFRKSVTAKQVRPAMRYYERRVLAIMGEQEKRIRAWLPGKTGDKNESL